ncbi:DUF3108 domain-containing protein [Methylophaga thiooxydans]|uniref:DUF3108 domain-containing protein n=1 Tax=Methylophaga thiooxydans TaxID=392484 RepID=UPI0023563DAE|nr:DUF3108 domain-containing protein [Methylophaga thiooxydans]
MLKKIGLFLFFSISTALAAQEIPDFSANYLVRLNGIQAGELKRSLETQESGLKRFYSVSQAKGVFSFFKPDLIEETSIWQPNNGNVKPHSYVYQRSGGKKDKTLAMDFDWQKNLVSIDDKKHPWQLELEPGTLDKLVYQISLMKDLKRGIKSIDYRIADGGKLKTYHITVLGKETITTPMGHIETIKLTRHREKPSDRETTLWCAPALNYLPVKLEHIEDDTSFTAVLRRLKGIDTDTAFTPLQSANAITQP